MNGNNDTQRIKLIADKIAFTPSIIAIELIDELSQLSKQYPNDYSFGLIVRSLIHQTHANLKS